MPRVWIETQDCWICNCAFTNGAAQYILAADKLNKLHHFMAKLFDN